MQSRRTQRFTSLPLVREISKARRITREQLARDLQVTFSAVNGSENGYQRPISAPASRLVELAEASEIPRRHNGSHAARVASSVRRGPK
jgi:transcriptional regulator with XRE-family HTH domain